MGTEHTQKNRGFAFEQAADGDRECAKIGNKVLQRFDHYNKRSPNQRPMVAIWGIQT